MEFSFTKTDIFLPVHILAFQKLSVPYTIHAHGDELQLCLRIVDPIDPVVSFRLGHLVAAYRSAIESLPLPDDLIF